jgi:hypothetical protein
MMTSNNNRGIHAYDKPIPQPTCDFPEDFIRNIESRFVTKRFPKMNSFSSRSDRKVEKETREN